MDLTDKQWDLLKIHIPGEELCTEPHRGRAWFDARKALNGILWILKTEAQWKYLLAEYGNFKTVHNRFQRWIKLGVIDAIVHDLATQFFVNSKIDTSVSFIDATFAPAKKGALVGPVKIGNTKRGKGGPPMRTKIMGIVDRSGLPVAIGTGRPQSNPQLHTKLSLQKKRLKNSSLTSKLAS